MFVYAKVYSTMLKAGTLDDYLNPRITAMNAALDPLAFDWNKKSAHGNYFRYLRNAQAGVNYQADFFAVDCFHLSEIGEATVAQSIARDVDPRDWQ